MSVMVNRHSVSLMEVDMILIRGRHVAANFEAKSSFNAGRLFRIQIVIQFCEEFFEFSHYLFLL